MKNKENIFKTKKITAPLSIISLIAGFFFLNKTITGNIILNHQSPFSLLPLIGLLLISCSVILGVYSIKK